MVAAAIAAADPDAVLENLCTETGPFCINGV